MKRVLVMALCFSVISGCGGLLSRKEAVLIPTRETKGKGEMVSLPAQLRSITSKLEKGGYISCAEPGPDIALSDTFNLIARIASGSSVNSKDASSVGAVNKFELNNNLQTSTAALELAGRTQTVLLAREFLYRTCEAASNNWLGDKEVRDAHVKIIDQIATLVSADEEKAKTSAAIAMAIATGKLDSDLLDTARTGVLRAIRDAAIKSFEDCLKKAGDDSKARNSCKDSFNKELN